MENGFHTCPVCGKENSAHGDRFCGKCEEKYLIEEEKRQRQDYQDYLARIYSMCSPDEGYEGHVATFGEFCRGMY
jgi:hypothetical protein